MASGFWLPVKWNPIRVGQSPFGRVGQRQNSASREFVSACWILKVMSVFAEKKRHEDFSSKLEKQDSVFSLSRLKFTLHAA